MHVLDLSVHDRGLQQNRHIGAGDEGAKVFDDPLKLFVRRRDVDAVGRRAASDPALLSALFDWKLRLGRILPKARGCRSPRASGRSLRRRRTDRARRAREQAQGPVRGRGGERRDRAQWRLPMLHPGVRTRALERGRREPDHRSRRTRARRRRPKTTSTASSSPHSSTSPATPSSVTYWVSQALSTVPTAVARPRPQPAMPTHPARPTSATR